MEINQCLRVKGAKEHFIRGVRKKILLFTEYGTFQLLNTFVLDFRASLVVNFLGLPAG